MSAPAPVAQSDPEQAIGLSAPPDPTVNGEIVPPDGGRQWLGRPENAYNLDMHDRIPPNCTSCRP
ncbi:MAG TPA: hypothetical protein VG321_10185 [Solirubrobacteraceae bacterium]|jgi:hypothetical protein|nr:hypothetical protein [Solirubrobacteraceae bacterium]